MDGFFIMFFGRMMAMINAQAAGGGFDPSTLNLDGWWDLSDSQYLFQAVDLATPVTTNGQAVFSVTDRSGSGNYLNATSNAPLWDSTGFLVFTDDLLEHNLTPDHPGVIIAVGRYDVGSSSNDAMMGGGSDHFQTDGTFHQFDGAGDITSTVADTQLAVLIANEEGSDIVFYIDGAVIGTNVGDSFSSSNVRIGGSGAMPSLVGDVFEAMTRITAMTAQEISDVTSYLKTKHGIA